MIFKEESFTLKGHEILLRSAREEDAQILIDGLKEVCGETEYLLAYPDEIALTVEDEIGFIRKNNEAEKMGLLLAFVDGDYAGNTSVRVPGRRKFGHRGNIGIALKLKYTEIGLGTEMLKRILDKMREAGLDQAELEVFEANARARHVYEKLGFREVGRIPNAIKTDDGMYSDEIHMVCPLNNAEYWDLYDADRKLTGYRHKRGEKFGEGQYYVCCEIWVMNSEGKLLTTKRHPDKKAGNQWEFGGGGTLAGETTSQSAVRELAEETGIQAAESELKLLGTYANKNYFQDIFLLKRDADLKDIRLQPEETVDVKWSGDADIQKMIESGEFVYSVGKRYNLFKDKLEALK
jgi:RimJ/RimL family protein N-acetyltransferase/8-oxo-dGTP pyrophosphatase MutT (NUDIX family)